jgi:hypothetical protein
MPVLHPGDTFPELSLTVPEGRPFWYRVRYVPEHAAASA